MTKLIPILSGRCLVVELPDGSEFPRIGNGVLKAERTHNDYSVSLVRLSLPPGNWRIIGMLSEVTEEQAKGVVDYFTTDEDFGKEDVFRDYKGEAFYDTALESLESSILAEGYYFSNPLGEEKEYKKSYTGHDMFFANHMVKYYEAQSRVLDRSRCLLLGRESN